MFFVWFSFFFSGDLSFLFFPDLTLGRADKFTARGDVVSPEKSCPFWDAAGFQRAV